MAVLPKTSNTRNPKTMMKLRNSLRLGFQAPGGRVPPGLPPPLDRLPQGLPDGRVRGFKVTAQS